MYIGALREAPMTITRVRLFFIVMACFSLRALLEAQQQARALTAADYSRAEKMLAQNLNGLVIGGAVTPNWLPDERFWYHTTTLSGANPIILVDPVKRTRQACTDAVAECRGLGIDSVPGQRGPGQRGGGGGGQRGGAGGNSSDGKPLSIS